MKDILVNFKVSIPEEDFQSESVILFHRWLPYKEGEEITVQSDNIELKIKFDINSTIWASDHTIEDIPKWINVTVFRLFVDATVKDVEDNLIKFMIENIKEEKSPNPELRKQFESIGQKILDMTIHHINRLITYCRVIKGQYWLIEFPKDFDMSTFFLQGKAKAKVLEEESQWFRWRPTHTSRGIGGKSFGDDEQCFVVESDWPNIKEFIFSNNRPNLILELLSKSEMLAANDFRRNAIIDCVSALEIALSEFSRNPIKDLFENNDLTRIDINNLENQIDHLGFSGSIRYLIPILFDKSQIETKDLINCYDAIDKRNNIIHNGQRDLDEKIFNRIYRSVKKVCKVLMQFTAT